MKVVVKTYSKDKVKLLFAFLIFGFSVHSQRIFDLARSGTVDQMQVHLQSYPEQLNQLSENGLSPFLLASYHGNNGVAKLLMEKGANLSHCYDEGSVIHALIYKNNLELLELLVNQGINLNDTCQFAQLGYPIHFAMALKRYEVIALLIKGNVDLNVKDQQGRDINQLISIYNDPKIDELFH
jgi:ankyrin repeat protein